MIILCADKPALIKTDRYWKVECQINEGEETFACGEGGEFTFEFSLNFSFH